MIELLSVGILQQQPAMTDAHFFTYTIWFFLIGFVGYYVLVTRPAVLKEESEKKFLQDLKKNDEILACGGIFGRVVQIQPDQVTVEIAQNVRIRVKPDQISRPRSETSAGDAKSDQKAPAEKSAKAASQKEG